MDLGIEPMHLAIVAIVLFNGIWNTAVGSTGGITFATLAATLGPAVAIPVQSVVEGTSAGYRIWHLREQVDFGFVGAFAAGGLLGGAVGLPALRAMISTGADDLFSLVVAGFILAVTWLPLAREISRSRIGPAVAGATTTFMSLFVGGMGAPIQAAVESRGEPPQVVIATYTTAIYLQYLLRLAAFGLTGAIIRNHAGLVAALIIASLVGTWVGARILVRIDPDLGRRLFRIAVTAIALSMVVRAVV